MSLWGHLVIISHCTCPYILCFVYAICMSCLQEITNLILATDMARHKDILEEFKSKLDNFDYNITEHSLAVNLIKQTLNHECSAFTNTNWSLLDIFVWFLIAGNDHLILRGWGFQITEGYIIYYQTRDWMSIFMNVKVISCRELATLCCDDDDV